MERKVPVAVAEGRVKFELALEDTAGTLEGSRVTSIEEDDVGAGGGMYVTVPAA